MSLRAYTDHVDDYNRTHTIEIHKSGYNDPVDYLKNTGSGYASFDYEKIDPKNPTDNPIQKGALEFSLWLQSPTLINEIKTADEQTFWAVHKVDGTQEWIGYIYNDLSTYEEGFDNHPFRITLMAKDFTDLGGKDYLVSGSLPDSRERVIATIAYLLNTVGFSMPIKTHTSWIEENLEASLTNYDYLNEIYHETKALREFGKTGDESDQPITVEEALNKLCVNHGLLLKQADGAYWIDQLTEYETPTSVQEATYDLTGSQTAFTTGNDLTVNANTSDLKVTIQQDNRDNSGLPGLKKVKNKFRHRTSISYFSIPSYIKFDGVDSTTYQSFFISDGDQRIRLELPEIDADMASDTAQQVNINIELQAGGYYWDGSDWQPSPTTFNVLFTQEVGSLWVGSYFVITDNLPADADGTVSLKLSSAQSTNSVAPNTTEYFSGRFEIINPTIPEGETVTLGYQLTQQDNYSVVLDLEDTWYGDGPTGYAPSTLRYSSNDDDQTVESWQRKGSTSYRNFHWNLLAEHVDTRRGWRRLLSATLKGLYYPWQILSYDSEYFYFIGGSWDLFTGNWEGELFSLDIETSGTDDFKTILNFKDGSSTGSTGGGTGGGGGGLDQSTADARYLQESNNLSDLDSASSAISNLGITATASELNILDGATLSTAELNQLDGNVFTSKIEGTIADFSGALDADTLRTDTGKFLSPTSYQFRNAGDTGFRDVEMAGLTATTGLFSDLLTAQGGIDVTGISDFDASTSIFRFNADALDRGAIRFTNDTGIIWDVQIRANESLRFVRQATSGSFEITGGLFEAQAGATVSGGTLTAEDATFSGLTTHQGGIEITGISDFDASAGIFRFNADASDRGAIRFTNDTGTIWDVQIRANESLRFIRQATSGSFEITGGLLKAQAGATVSGGTLTAEDATFSGLTTHQGGIEITSGNLAVNKTGASEALDVNGNGMVSGTLTAGGLATLKAGLEDNNFTSGFQGSNWQVTTSGDAEFENMLIRGGLEVYELILNQIRYQDGGLIIGHGGGKVDTVSGGAGSEEVTFKDPEGNTNFPFSAGSIVLIQSFDLDSTTVIKKIVREVSSITTGTYTLTTPTGWTAGTANDDTGAIAAGDDMVAIGHATDTTLDSFLYMSAVDSNNPFLRIMDGVDNYNKFDLSAGTALRLQLGNLNGTYDYASETYGLAAGNPGADYITVDSSNGVRFVDGADSNKILGQFSSQVLTFGDVSESDDFIKFDNSGTNVSVSAVLSDLDLEVIGSGSAGFGNADFFLDASAHQISLGDVFSADGGEGTGDLAGWSFNDYRIRGENGNDLINIMSNAGNLSASFDNGKPAIDVVEINHNLRVNMGAIYGKSGETGFALQSDYTTGATLFQTTVNRSTGDLTALIAGANFDANKMWSFDSLGAGVELNWANQRLFMRTGSLGNEAISMELNQTLDDSSTNSREAEVVTDTDQVTATETNSFVGAETQEYIPDQVFSFDQDVDLKRDPDHSFDYTITIRFQAFDGNSWVTLKSNQTTHTVASGSGWQLEQGGEILPSVALNEPLPSTRYEKLRMRVTFDSFDPGGQILSITPEIRNNSSNIRYNLTTFKVNEYGISIHRAGNLGFYVFSNADRDTVEVEGSFDVNGTKNFKIDHPHPDKNDSHYLLHSSVESPNGGDTIYRYTIQADSNDQLVEKELPDYFKYLNEDVDVWVNGQSDYLLGYGWVEGNTLKVKCEKKGTYKVLIMGTRKDPGVKKYWKGTEILKSEY